MFKKCRTDNDNVVFIDASNEFEKVKAQNFLSDKNVTKIITTLKERKDIEKYAHLTSLDEVKENDYNLNIPRYVDTFEEEEAVDLDVVSKTLKDLENEMIETDKTIASFCGELNIAQPF